MVVLLPFIHETISQLRAITDPLGRLLRRRTTTYGEPRTQRGASGDRRGSGGVTSAVRNRLPLVTS
jgi:FO synthase